MAKILLVEDDVLLVRMYQKKLEMDSNHVLIATDGETGLKIAETEKPDLILLDILLPKMNGFDVLKAVKAHEEIKNTPIILLTNLGNDEESVEKGLELGAVAYLIKSNIVPADVVAKIREVLSASRADELPNPVST